MTDIITATKREDLIQALGFEVVALKGKGEKVGKEMTPKRPG